MSDPAYDENGKYITHLSGVITHILQRDGTYVVGGPTTVVFPDDWKWEPYPGCNVCEDQLLAAALPHDSTPGEPKKSDRNQPRWVRPDPVSPS